MSGETCTHRILVSADTFHNISPTDVDVVSEADEVTPQRD